MPNTSTITPPPPRRSLVLKSLVALATAALLALGFTTVTVAQTGSGETEVTGRIIARLLSDGRIEFGWRPAGGGEDILPSQRAFPAAVDHNRWLNSSDVTVGGIKIGRINARLGENDPRVEFAFAPAGGERIFPSARYFPENAPEGRWLRSTEISFDLPGSDPPPEPTVEEMEEAILRVLFGGVAAQANYNDYGCPNTHGQAGIECSRSVWSASELRNKRADDPVPAGYQGGHAGWDAQTLSVAGSATANERFYAVSPGVIKRNGSPTVNLIAVWHEPSNTTTLYMHARSLNSALRVGSRVQVGTWLGIQGDRGSSGAEHVHIEVRAGEWTVGSGGADQSLAGPACNPVEFLYRSIQGRSTVGHECGRTSPPAGDLIRVAGTQDVYHVQGGYRRLIIAGGIINAVPQFRWDAISDVSQATMNRYEVSRLVRLPNDGGKVYLVETTGADTARLRHIPSEAAFTGAGCEWPAVYDITAEEAEFKGYLEGAPMPANGWSCR